jgi:hypothetical protein
VYACWCTVILYLWKFPSIYLDVGVLFEVISFFTISGVCDYSPLLRICFTSLQCPFLCFVSGFPFSCRNQTENLFLILFISFQVTALFPMEIILIFLSIVYMQYLKLSSCLPTEGVAVLTDLCCLFNLMP